MRIALVILSLVVCGCDFGSSGPAPNQTIRNGKDRLTRKIVESGVPVPGGVAYDFHSLIWESEDGDFWRERAVITQQQFEAGTDRHRWVSQLQSFDPKTGNAIIKVAEGNAPTNAKSVSFVYSWREWNLLTNAEVRLIRICTDPFEGY